MHSKDPFLLSVNYFPNGDMVSAISTTMLGTSYLQCCWESYTKYNNFTKSTFFKTSTYNHREYPNFVIAPSHKKALNDLYTDSPNSMQFLCMWEMLPHNVSLQESLLEVMNNIKTLITHDTMHYTSIIIDPGIYYWAKKVYHINIFIFY
jgi:hypothetical protein